MNQVHTKSRVEEKASFFMGYLLLNIAWCLALVFVSFIYGQIVARIDFFSFFYTSPWYKGFIIEITPLLIIQGILHWVTLKHFFPNLHRGNIIWVAIMPFLFICGYGIMAAIIFILAARSGVLR